MKHYRSLRLLLCAPLTVALACTGDGLNNIEQPEHIPEALAPIARCGVSPAIVNSQAGEPATWTGSESADPGGAAIVSYTWSLTEAPDSSNAVLPDCDGHSDCGPFIADVGGDYTVTLTVENEHGLSDSCSATLVAEPTGPGPVAVCSVTPNGVDPHLGETATWLGADSYDPAGFEIISYIWRLAEKPAGSTATIPAACTGADCGPFVADRDGTYVARLTVTNEIGQTDTCLVSLDAVRAGVGPTAACSVTPAVVHPPFESASFSGAGSTDPDGYDLTYSWSLESAPEGSAVALPSCNGPTCGPFTPDVAGTYAAVLTVTNEIGQTASCTATLEAVPLQDLWVEMFWQHAGDDMDLHLLRPGGAERSSGDCYFSNCTGGLAWGQAGTADDPTLDLDDISEVGPENINISAPASGIYKVFVHDYPASSYGSANQVTVNVYVNGVPVFSDTRAISGEDSDTYFCQIDWPAGTVTPL